MKIAFVSNSSPYDRLSRSGVPYSIFHQLMKYYEIEWIKPNPKDTAMHLVLFAVVRLVMLVMEKLNFGYWHVPLQLYLECKSVDRQLEGKHFDAIFSMGWSGTAYLNTKLPIFFRADAIAPSALEYYIFNVPKFARQWSFNVEKNLLDRATIFFTASEWIIDEIKKYNIGDPYKCVFVPTGANLDLDYVKYRSHNYGQDTPLHLLFVGYDLERKGFGIAYETMRLLKTKYNIDATLTVIGGVPDTRKYNDPSLIVVGKLNKNRKVEFDRFYDEFYNCDLFIFPTKAEFHGIVNCEAAAYGLPIFANNTGGVSSYCIDGVNGRCLKEGSTAQDYADAIYNSIREGKMNMFSENSRKLFLEKYNWDSWGKVVHKVMSEIIN